jgi:hypothetical protein
MPQYEGQSTATGSLGLTVIRGDGTRRAHPAGTLVEYPSRQLSLAEIAHHGMPRKGLPDPVNRWRKSNQPNLRRGLRRVLLARAFDIPHFYGQLFLTVLRGDGTIEELGLAGMRMVTTVGARFICDDMNNNTTDVTNLKFHGFGTGAGAEAVGNTALSTEETTQYAPDNTRPTGSQASATVGNDGTYTTVGTYSPDSGTNPRPITEHGIFTQAATGGGTLLDKTLFSVVNLVPAADSLQATYVFTLVAGG